MQKLDHRAGVETGRSWGRHGAWLVALTLGSAACSADEGANPRAGGGPRTVPQLTMPATGAAGSAMAAGPAIGGSPASTVPMGAAGSAAPNLTPQTTDTTNMAPAAGMQGATMAPQPVLVDPADEAACDPTGTPPQPGEDIEVIKIRTDDPNVIPGGYQAPGGTVYACFWIDIDMPEKHHIIGWEGAVAGDRAVHHQQVSVSQKPFYLFQQGGLCGLPTVEYTWTGEKPTEWTPKLAGYPIGGPENGGKAHFLWQVHFESATTYTGGFNVYATKNLRKYDAGNFEQGDVSGIMIPPMSAATHEAKCTSDMTRQKLIQPIYIYAAMQHAHLTIKHMKSELSRDGMVIKTFGDQDASGFVGFFDQQFKPVKPCQKVLPGDEFRTVCDYQNPTNMTIMGGEATNQEMCTTFFQYFPRLPGTSNNFCGTIDSTGGFNPMP